MIARETITILNDTEFDVEDSGLKFTLTYEGELKSGQTPRQSVRKHQLRRHFHPQLKRLWETNVILRNWYIPIEEERDEKFADMPIEMGRGRVDVIHARDWMPEKVTQLKGFTFLPLISKDLCVESALEIRILRPTDKPGNVPDLDNIVKTLCDGLRKPDHKSAIEKAPRPSANENPFYVLLDDDSLLNKILVTGDELLSPLTGKSKIDPHDVRVFIDVMIRPLLPQPYNNIFFADDAQSWDCLYDKSVPSKLDTLSNSELKYIASQCVLRLMNFHDVSKRFQNSIFHDESLERSEQNKKSLQASEDREIIWQTTLWPKVKAISFELERRQEQSSDGTMPTYQRDMIDSGMLVGANPLAEIASRLERLVYSLA